MPNRLQSETSPYLLQHADNPVDWYPWGDEALQRARAEDRPLLVSIGYSACHWCHVMARESFEDDETARIMNEQFVNVKVDREERPDLDHLYQQAVQSMGGYGGWPLNVFLTPQGEPFFGGTYFPTQEHRGTPAFRRVLLSVASSYLTERARVAEAAAEMVDQLRRLNRVLAVPVSLDATLLDQAYRRLLGQFDPVAGGLRGAPKFPMSSVLEFLLRMHHRTGDERALHLLEVTLDNMARGGIYDQLGGGFHRYAVDSRWAVPHFEKMLYDNALLSRLYLHAYQATGKPLYRTVVEETLAYVQREMAGPEGQFYAGQDADSEGHEGRFYTWTPEEVLAVLGPADGGVLIGYYGLMERGRVEGRHALRVVETPEALAESLDLGVESVRTILDRGRSRLREAREQRAKPGRDEKVLAGWNSLMLSAFAEASLVLGRDDYRNVAEANATFLLQHLRHQDRLHRSYKDGRSQIAAYLQDYAYLAEGLLALYRATFDLRWLNEARSLVDTMIDLFWDDSQHVFYFTSREQEPLVVRPLEMFDAVLPSGNSVAVDVLLQLSELVGDLAYRRRAERVIENLGGLATEDPTLMARLLSALDFARSSSQEVVIVGGRDQEDTRHLLQAVFRRYRPNLVIAGRAPEDQEAAQAVPLLADRGMVRERASAYLCRHYQCASPVTDPDRLEALLEGEVSG